MHHDEFKSTETQLPSQVLLNLSISKSDEGYRSVLFLAVHDGSVDVKSIDF